MSTSGLAIATCSTSPHAEPSDRPLLAALARLNILATRIPWNDPAADWSRFSAAIVRSTWHWRLHPATCIGRSVSAQRTTPACRSCVDTPRIIIASASGLVARRRASVPEISSALCSHARC